jgi:hypothetical protein
MWSLNKTKIPIWLQWVVLACSLFLLIFPAISNGYPLIYPDTGTYIASGHSGEVPLDRPLMYGLFVRHISMSASLWPVIIFQAVFVALILLLLAKYFWPESYISKTILLITILSLLTAVPYHTSQIMADIFIPLLILSVFCFMQSISNSKTAAVLTGAFIVFSSAVHYSGLMIVTVLAIILLIFSFFTGRKRFPIKKPLWLMIVVIIAWLFIPSFNYLNGGGFRYSRAGNIFMIARLGETGILSDYLEENCGKKDIPLCKYKEKFPMSLDYFLWHDSPLNDYGQQTTKWDSVWIQKNIEYAPIVKDILTTPSLAGEYGLVTIKSTFIQLTSFSSEKLPPMLDRSPVLPLIKWHYPSEVNAYLNSNQSKSGLVFNRESIVQYIFVLLSLTGLIIILIIRKTRRLLTFSHILLAIICFSGLIVNAMVCVCFSTIADRFQSRVMWLVPLVFIIFIIDTLMHLIIKKRE